MDKEPWQIALDTLENLHPLTSRWIICRMLGRLEAFDETSLDWFVDIINKEAEK